LKAFDQVLESQTTVRETVLFGRIKRGGGFA
jgi:hypothetical protein